MPKSIVTYWRVGDPDARPAHAKPRNHKREKRAIFGTVPDQPHEMDQLLGIFLSSADAWHAVEAVNTLIQLKQIHRPGSPRPERKEDPYTCMCDGQDWPCEDAKIMGLH
jgi:hypothetical protein